MKYPYKYWHWTSANENLFDLDKFEYYLFKLLVDEAFKTQTSANNG